VSGEAPEEPPARRRAVRLLLINPRFPESFWSFRWALEHVLPGKKRALNPPLGLATLAGLCPPDWDVRIVDENVESVPLEPEADIIGVCGMAIQFERQRELLSYYRRRGHFVVAGGSYASLCPERYTDLVDTVVAGEAEEIWPAFCRDFAAGAPQALYRETGVVDLEHSRVPRFDLLDLDRYTTASVQFSRGCPYRCEFCDIIVMFGRRPRTKRPEQIGRELDALRAHGVRNVFFVDDNLIGHKAKAKELLRYLVEYQRRHDYRFEFGTEASLNAAEDDELLDLLREAGFTWVFVGIESPDEASLKEAGKTQNMRGDILAAVQHIYSKGIDVLAGFIVGFDNDTTAVFDRQYRFINGSGIVVAMIGLLTALPRTPLYARLEREGRLLPDAGHGDNTALGTNFQPSRMSYQEMLAGYRTLYRRLLRDSCIAERIRNKVQYLQGRSYTDVYSVRERLGILARFLLRGVLPGGPGRWFHFLRSLAAARLSAWPQVISDWVAGLALRAYAERHLAAAAARGLRVARAAADAIGASRLGGPQRGAFSVSVTATDAGQPQMTVTLRSGLGSRFFAFAGRKIERLLRRSRTTLVLRIETLAASERALVQQWLQGLTRYGDRISVLANAELRRYLGVDSSVFHLVLDEV
jgi:radical SAM superfamily enzyme YgiQ (UPF0313 family)